MAEQEPDPNDLAQLTTWAVANTRHVRIRYRGCTLYISYPSGDVGLDDMARLLDQLPEIFANSVEELGVREAMQNIDKEIEDLLGDDDERS